MISPKCLSSHGHLDAFLSLTSDRPVNLHGIFKAQQFLNVSKIADPTLKDNRHRVNAWMESAPEEHSSQAMPSIASDPNFRNQRASLDSRPDSAPAETNARANSSDDSTLSAAEPLKNPGLATLRESEECSTNHLSKADLREGSSAGAALTSAADFGKDNGTACLRNALHRSPSSGSCGQPGS